MPLSRWRRPKAPCLRATNSFSARSPASTLALAVMSAKASYPRNHHLGTPGTRAAFAAAVTSSGRTATEESRAGGEAGMEDSDRSRRARASPVGGSAEELGSSSGGGEGRDSLLKAYLRHFRSLGKNRTSSGPRSANIVHIQRFRAVQPFAVAVRTATLSYASAFICFRLNPSARGSIVARSPCTGSEDHLRLRPHVAPCSQPCRLC